MKWLFFFLVLSFVATAALAAPSNSPSVPKEEGSPTVPKDDSLTVSKNDPSTSKDVLPDLQPELLTLVYSKSPRREQLRMQLTCKQFKDWFQSPHLDSVNTEAEFKVLDQYRGLNQEAQLDEAMISKFVQEYDFEEADVRHAVEVARKHTEYTDTLLSKLQKIRRGVYSKIIDAAVESIVNSLPVKVWDEVLDGNVYNDDKNMDDLLYSLMHREETHVRRPKFKEILKEARQAIKEKRSQLEHPYAQNLEVDTQMIQEVMARLPATANEDHIREIMKQARHANSLTGAAVFNLQHALRELVASDIDIPVSIFEDIVFKAYETNPQVKSLIILRLHPSFQADVFLALINHITNGCDYKSFPLFELLLKDEMATPDIIKRATENILQLESIVRPTVKAYPLSSVWFRSPFFNWALKFQSAGHQTR